MKRDGSTLSNLLRNDEEEIVSEKDMGRDDAENESDGSPEHEFGPTGAGGGHGGGAFLFLLAHLTLPFPE
jgi:hypothetical protein